MKHLFHSDRHKTNTVSKYSLAGFSLFTVITAVTILLLFFFNNDFSCNKVYANENENSVQIIEIESIENNHITTIDGASYEYPLAEEAYSIASEENPVQSAVIVNGECTALMVEILNPEYKR